MPGNQAKFVEPMLLLRTEKLPEGPDWLIELKLDGYRALAIKSGGKVQLRSRNDNDFNVRYPSIVEALAALPDDTVIDGEVVALDADGRPSFNMLQNYGSARGPLYFFIFDLLMLSGRDVMAEPLVKRRDLIEKRVLPKLAGPIRYSPTLEASLKDLISSVKAQGLEGLVAKRRDSKYEPGLRQGLAEDAGQSRAGTGHWRIHAIAQELRRACYRLLRGCQPDLRCPDQERFHTSSRAELFKTIKPLEIEECPFANLPEKKAGRWGAGLTAAKMMECKWLLCRIRHSSHNVECRTMPYAAFGM